MKTMGNNLIAISGKANSGKDTVGKIIQYLTTVDNPTTQEFINRHINNNQTLNKSQWEIKKFADKLKDIVCILLGCTREQLEDREFKEKELGEEWWYCQDERDGPLINYEDALDGSVITKLTPRKIMQLIGTEAGRDIIHPNIWINALFADYKPYPKQKWYESKNPLTGYMGNCKVCGERWHSPNKHNSFCKKHNELQPDIYPNWIITDLRFPNEFQAIKNRGGITIRVNRPKYGYESDLPEKSSPLQHAERGKELHNHPSETALDNAEFDFVIDNNSSIEDLTQEVKDILVKLNLIS